MTASTSVQNLRRIRRLVLGIAGLLSVAGMWEFIGQAELLGRSWPPLTVVLETLLDPDRADLHQRALMATLREGVTGFLWGSGLAVGLAVVASLSPLTQQSADGFAVLVQAVPIVALGPIMISVLERDLVPIVLAAVASFFVVFVATTSGLTSARTQHHELFTVYGAGRARRLLRLRIPYALPAIGEGLRLAAPASILGAVIGEWFGTESGVGPLLVVSMQRFQINELWAAGVLGAIPAIGLYAVASGAAGGMRARFGDV